MGEARGAETAVKWDRVRGYLDWKGLHGLFLVSRANFAWATGGGDDHVGLATEAGVATLFLARDRRCVITDNIEAPRLRAEEVLEPDWEFLEVPWHEPRARDRAVLDLAAGRPVESDLPLADLPIAGPDLAALRFSLLPEELERYRWLGREAAISLETAGRQVKPGDTESRIASAIAARILPAQMEPVVLLVAADDRIDRFRHPIPTSRAVRERAMLVLCARRWGLIVAATRMLHFGPPPAELRRRMEAVRRVDAALIAATRPGARWGEILAQGIAAYGKEGFPEEWRLHHQGGPTGYAGRDFRVAESETRLVEPCQAFAWNPSIAGAKSEDTLVALPAGNENLTRPQEWPASLVSGIERAEMLVL